MNYALSIAVDVLEVIFSAGCIGSFLVILLTAIDDVETILHKEPVAPEPERAHGTPAYN